MTDVLRGVRVIDFGQYIAGPMAAMLLGDFGADVVRVDPQGGPRYDVPANATWNRGKRSIALDLKLPSDLSVARHLIETADVVIENFRPGVMDRLGLGAKAMTALNARLIYCSMPGFPADDPRAGVKGWEGVVGAATGVFSPHVTANLNRPVYTVLPLSSVYAAYLCAVSAVMALLARDQSGVGQIIETPTFNATFMAFSGKLMKTHGSPTAEPKPKWRHVRCGDGRWFMYIPGKLEKRLLEELCIEGVQEGELNAEELDRHLARVFESRPAQEWEDFFAQHGVEGITCNTNAEWLQHPVALENGIVADFDDPVLGRFRGPGVSPRLSHTPGRVRRSRPLLDAHRAEILRELTDARRQGTRLPSRTLKAALEGVKVLDLGIILASPSCGRTLAEFGADVIKIDSPTRNPVNWHNDINRAKRSIILDLKSKEGQEVFWRLVQDADVILENFRTGVADKLGIGYEAVQARRPSIVYCSVNAFGHTGRYSRRPGREPVAQAIAGMQLRYGGEKPALNPYNANDYGTGLIACYGVALALLHSRRTGRGQHIHAALTQAATMLQSNVLHEYEGKEWGGPQGQEALGEGALYRAYEASDAWIFLAAQATELARCPQLADIAQLSGVPLERALERRFMERSAASWVELLTSVDIGAHRVVLALPPMMEDALVRAQGLSITRHHDELGLVTTTGPAMKLSRTPTVAGRAAPKPGSDASDILDEIGLGHDVDRLIREGVVVVDGIYAGGAS